MLLQLRTVNLEEKKRALALIGQGLLGTGSVHHRKERTQVYAKRTNHEVP